jgi:hypothetical protein
LAVFSIVIAVIIVLFFLLRKKRGEVTREPSRPGQENK